jgi:hypothetical protein
MSRKSPVAATATATSTAVLLLVLGMAGVAKADLYSLVNDPGDQNGYTLTGTITTSGEGTVGSLGIDITAWNLTISGPSGTFAGTSADPGAGISSSGAIIIANSTALTVSGGYLEFYDQTTNVGLAWQPGTQDYEALQSKTVLWNMSPALGFKGSTWTVATESSLAAPEPSSFVTAAVVGGCGIAYGLARQRREKKRKAKTAS